MKSPVLPPGFFSVWGPTNGQRTDERRLIDPYILFLFGLGAVILAVAWLPLALRRLPLSLSIVCIGFGLIIFGFDILKFDPNPRTYDTLVEKLCEAVVVISLMGAGLKSIARLDCGPGQVRGGFSALRCL
jgi:hypothetical protein